MRVLRERTYRRLMNAEALLGMQTRLLDIQTKLVRALDDKCMLLNDRCVMLKDMLNDERLKGPMPDVTVFAPAFGGTDTTASSFPVKPEKEKKEKAKVNRKKSRK